MNRHLFIQGYPSQLWELREYESQLEEEERKEELNRQHWNRMAFDEFQEMMQRERAALGYE